MLDYQKLKKDLEDMAFEGCHFFQCLKQVIFEISTVAMQLRPNEIAVLKKKLQFLDVMDKLWKMNPDYITPLPPQDSSVSSAEDCVEHFETLQVDCQRRINPAAEKQKSELHERKSWPALKEKLQELANWHQQLNPLSSSEEVHKFSRQLERVSQLSAILLKTKDRVMSAEAWACYNDIYALLVSMDPFSEQMEELVKLKTDRLTTLMNTGLGISESEKIQIINAMGLSSGHWYKCPNGHIYAVGDCGRATEFGICPECKCSIGGNSSVGNCLATEMNIR